MEVGGIDGACWISPYKVRVLVDQEKGHGWRREQLIRLESRFGISFEVWTHQGHDFLGKLRKGLIFACIKPG